MDIGKRLKAVVGILMLLVVLEFMPVQKAWANVSNGDPCPTCGESLTVSFMGSGEYGSHQIYCRSCGYGMLYESDDPLPRYDVFEPHWGGTATCTALAVCEGCNEEYGALDPNKHSGTSTVTGKKAATCTEAGYTGDTTWDCCGAEVKGETIAALGHSWGAWTVTKEATTSEEGIETRVCSNKSTHTETRKIAKKEETKEEETKKEEPKKEAAKAETVSKTTDTQPQTGDENQTVWVIMMMLSAAILIVLAIRKRRVFD